MQPCMYCRSYTLAIGCGLTDGVLTVLEYLVVCPSLPPLISPLISSSSITDGLFLVYSSIHSQCLLLLNLF